MRPRLAIRLASTQPAELHEIPIAVTGSWVKDGRRFSITFDDLSDILANFNRRKNNQVVVDYEHASEDPKVAKGNAVPAAGWIMGMELRGGTLFADVEWTDEARNLIEGGKYRFISPAIDWEAKRKDDGKAAGATLTSMALTNHPFLEELPPLMLSEAGAAALADDEQKKVIVPVVPDATIKVKIKPEKGDRKDLMLADGEAGLSDEELSELHGRIDLKEIDPDVKEGVNKSDYAYVGDAGDKSTWKYKLDTPGRVRNALARWGQHKGIPSADEPAALRKILVRAKRHGIEVDKDNPKYKIAASELADTSLEQRRSAVQDAINKQYGTDWPGLGFSVPQPWIRELFDDYAICEAGSKLWKVGYSIDADGNAKLDEPVRVKVDYVEASEMKDDKGKPGDVETRPVAMGGGKRLDDMDSYGVKGDKGMQKDLRKEAEKRAQDIDDVGEDAEDAVLMEVDDKGDPVSRIPRLKVRRVKSKDGIGKMRHHALIGGDGKLVGYLTHGDLADYAQRSFMKHPDSDDNANGQAMSDAIREATGRPLKLSDVTRMVEFAIENEDRVTSAGRRKRAFSILVDKAFDDQGAFSTKLLRNAHRLLLSDTTLGASDREATTFVLDFQDAAEDVQASIARGKFIPMQRKALLTICLSDRKAYDELVNGQLPVINYSPVGVGGTGREGGTTAAQELDAMTRRHLTEKKMDDSQYSAAFSEVRRQNPELNQRYLDEQRDGKRLV